MDLISQKIETSKLKEGDHIYTWRKQIYSHHGIFVGDGKIIHFVSTIRYYLVVLLVFIRKEAVVPCPIVENGYGKYDLMNNNCEDFALYCKTGLWSTNKESQGRSSQANMVHSTRHAKKDKDLVESVTRISTSIPRSFSKRENKDLGHRNDVVKVPVEELSSFLRSLYRFKYEASLEFLYAKARGGTCSMAKSDPPEDVLHRATYLYENGHVKYDLMNNNCEDFALYCKTGLWSTDIESQGRSSQANTVRSTRHAKKEIVTAFQMHLSLYLPSDFQLADLES
nr:putative endopeptidase, NLPC/P60 domain, LRAT-like domain protein [Tanacetum cinerariifolium]